MKILFLMKRIGKQVLRDKRTLALLFIAPILVIALLNYIFPDPDDEITIAAVNVDADIIDILEDEQVYVKEEQDIDAETYLQEGHANGVLEEKGEEWTLTILNDNPIDEGSTIQSSSQAVMESNITHLADNIEELIDNMQGISQAIEQMPPEVQENMDSEMMLDTEFDTTIDMDNEALSVNYIYGDDNHRFFDIINPVLVSFFVFFFVFLISGMAMLKERSSGTLDKLLSTPIKKSDIICGYLFGYGIFAVLQTAVIILFSVYILDMDIAGSLVTMFMINILLSFVALGLGLLLSTFVKSEFQMMQFIPLIIIPQIFFSGMLKVESMEPWLQWIAPIMPLYHAGNSMIDVVLKGAGFQDLLLPLSILFLLIVLFAILNIFGMRRYRKV
ncbi:ABC transporter permease [Virgibacillus sp. NKC19-3]|uniref:ABC transporter permease n=1 Tax=Virgibacillus saliphilus TaxID=2831674 RepID=UPI001C9B8D6E|nr:ABC transporter permease [Virgibacillus sp. NKC19-3]MBY7144160.1 ABC transporter permease [Virgibacillus sp. NKC19-3]